MALLRQRVYGPSTMSGVNPTLFITVRSMVMVALSSENAFHQQGLGKLLRIERVIVLGTEPC